jgi:hypothetical protein
MNLPEQTPTLLTLSERHRGRAARGAEPRLPVLAPTDSVSGLTKNAGALLAPSYPGIAIKALGQDERPKPEIAGAMLPHRQVAAKLSADSASP